MNKLTQNQFLEKANNAHNFKYDYSDTIYLGLSENITVNCRIHGRFEQSARNHIYAGSGCIQCSKEQKRSRRISKFKDLAIADFLQKHGHRYDYSKFIYENNSKKSAIICKEHGVFYQSANNHKAGKGCSKCCKELMIFKRSGYVETCKKNHNSKSKLYLLKIIDHNGCVFYKIGITVQDISKRFVRSAMPYSYEVLRVVESDAGRVFDAETKIKKMVFDSIYKPLVKFRGSRYECFTEMNEAIYVFFDSLEDDGDA